MALAHSGCPHPNHPSSYIIGISLWLVLIKCKLSWFEENVSLSSSSWLLSLLKKHYLMMTRPIISIYIYSSWIWSHQHNNICQYVTAHLHAVLIFIEWWFGTTFKKKGRPLFSSQQSTPGGLPIYSSVGWAPKAITRTGSAYVRCCKIRRTKLLIYPTS